MSTPLPVCVLRDQPFKCMFLFCSWIESDREEQMKDVLHGHEKEHHMKSALENQKKLSPRPSPRSKEGKAFDPTGATTRNVQVPPFSMLELLLK